MKGYLDKELINNAENYMDSFQKLEEKIIDVILVEIILFRYSELSTMFPYWMYI